MPGFLQAWPVSALVAVGLCGPMVCGREPPQAALVRADAGVKIAETSRKKTTLLDDDDDLSCLLGTQRGRILLQFGYRGCFGGSDNDLDLDVAATASLSGHLFTGISSNRATEGVALTREQGRTFLWMLVDALRRPEAPNESWQTTKAFVRVSYWCGTRHEGPLMFETNAPSEADLRSWDEAFHLKRSGTAREYPYSPVHAAIAAARKILEEVPGKDVDSSEQLESARRRGSSLYENGLRVRHDPLEPWKDP